MKSHERLTQKDLKFGIYWGRDGKEKAGLHIWLNGRYVWPRERKVMALVKVKAARKPRAKKEDAQLPLLESNAQQVDAQ